MVFFVVTTEGYNELRRICRQTPSPLWAGADVLSPAEVDALRSTGASVSVFNYAIDPGESEVVEEALATIAQHHPNERIWVERKGDV